MLLWSCVVGFRSSPPKGEPSSLVCSGRQGEELTGASTCQKTPGSHGEGLRREGAGKDGMLREQGGCGNVGW